MTRWGRGPYVQERFATDSMEGTGPAAGPSRCSVKELYKRPTLPPTPCLQKRHPGVLGLKTDPYRSGNEAISGRSSPQDPTPVALG